MFWTDCECPVCAAQVTDWSSRCAKCGYHPDCSNGYNRAQNDVALLARSATRFGGTPAGMQHASRWRRHLPAWLGGYRSPAASN